MSCTGFCWAFGGLFYPHYVTPGPAFNGTLMLSPSEVCIAGPCCKLDCWVVFPGVSSMVHMSDSYCKHFQSGVRGQHCRPPRSMVHLPVSVGCKIVFVVLDFGFSFLRVPAKAGCNTFGGMPHPHFLQQQKLRLKLKKLPRYSLHLGQTTSSMVHMSKFVSAFISRAVLALMSQSCTGFNQG